MVKDRLYITLSQHIISLYDIYEFFEYEELEDESRECTTDNNLQILETLGIISVCRACEDNCIRFTNFGRRCNLFEENGNYVLSVPVELEFEHDLPF